MVKNMENELEQVSSRDNYEHYGFGSLYTYDKMLPQIDLKMILAVIEAPTLGSKSSWEEYSLTIFDMAQAMGRPNCVTLLSLSSAIAAGPQCFCVHDANLINLTQCCVSNQWSYAMLRQ